MNPNRLIPVLEDGGTVVWESNAIVRYLAARYGAGSLWPEDPAQRALADRWMDWQLSTAQPAMGPVFRGLIRTPPEQRDQAAIAAGAERLVAAMRLLDGHLAGRRFVAGDALTMGDVPVGCVCWRYRELPIARPELPNLDRWFERAAGARGLPAPRDAPAHLTAAAGLDAAPAEGLIKRTVQPRRPRAPCPTVRAASLAAAAALLSACCWPPAAGRACAAGPRPIRPPRAGSWSRPRRRASPCRW